MEDSDPFDRLMQMIERIESLAERQQRLGEENRSLRQ